MWIKLPNSVKYILNLLLACDFEAYIVGGCVRDSIMGIVPHDWDITTNAKPKDIIHIFRSKGFKVLETGLKHGTVTVMIDSEPFEVTTYRVDGDYTDGRHPDNVQFTTSLLEDLSRRDFTINALAYNAHEGIIDVFDGLKDIQAKCIRCVGNPTDRFNEDALRIMRALRFAARLGFNIETNTAKAIFANKEKLRKVSFERLNSEFTKLIEGFYSCNVLQTFAEVIGVFIPEIMDCVGFVQVNPYHDKTVWNHCVACLFTCNSLINQYSTCSADAKVLRLAALFHDIEKPACASADAEGTMHFYNHAELSGNTVENILKRLRFETETIQRVTKLIRNHDTPIQAIGTHILRWLNKMGNDLALLLALREGDIASQSDRFFEARYIMLQEARVNLQKALNSMSCFKLNQLALNGNDLKEMGFKQGKLMGEILNYLLQEVMDNKLPNDKNILKNTVIRVFVLKEEY